MELLAKIKTDAKAGWDDLFARYAAIQSPVARLAIIVGVVLLLAFAVVHFLPWLILLVVIGGVGFAAYAAIKDNAP